MTKKIMKEQRPGIMEYLKELGLVARLVFDPRTDPSYEQFVLRRRLRQRDIDEGRLTRPTTLLGKVREVFEDFKSAVYGSNRY